MHKFNIKAHMGHAPANPGHDMGHCFAKKNSAIDDGRGMLDGHIKGAGDIAPGGHGHIDLI